MTDQLEDYEQDELEPLPDDQLPDAIPDGDPRAPIDDTEEE